MRRARPLTFLTITAGLLVSGYIFADVERREQGNLVIEGIPEIPESVSRRLLQYGNTRSAGLQAWHPSGEGILITTRFGETEQVHWVKQPGGARLQVTFFNESVRSAAMSPSPEVQSFIFPKDVGGSEFYHLFFFDLATGEYRVLTEGKGRNLGVVWAHDGKRYAYSTTRRNERDYDIHLGDITKTGESRPLLEEGGAWFVSEWSPDDKKLLVGRYISASETRPHILELETGTLTRFNPTEGKVAYGDAQFAKNGKGIYYTSDEGGEFLRLRFYDGATGETTVLTGGIPWDVGSFDLSEDGKFLAFVVNEDGISRLHVRNLVSGGEVALPDVPVGEIYDLRFSPAGHVLGMVFNTPRTPGDVYALDLDTGKLTRWTSSEVGGLRSDEFVVPELIRYESFDRVDGEARTIPAFYYRPKGDGPFPVVVDIHGGPESQERPSFNPTVQYAVNELGIAVLAPNVRGSAGYGKTYLTLDNGYKREDSVKDIGRLLDWIATRPELDSDRVAVIGGSYGGYMVLASMVHYGERLRAGIDVVGISNFVTFLENTQAYRRDLRREEYGDERDPEMRKFLEKISPLNSAAKITKPLLVIQGLNDPRVPVTESEQMVEVIRKAGGTVWYLLAKDEGHGFRKKSNRDYYYAAVSLFLEKFLLGEDAAGKR